MMAYYYGLGRRKSSTARVRLTPKGKGNIVINGLPINEYFSDSQYIIHEIEKPFIALEQENTYDISIKVSGGGHTGQVQAIRLGLSKALVEMNPDYKNTLKRSSLLGRDPREKERKKFGLKGARKQRQFTKR